MSDDAKLVLIERRVSESESQGGACIQRAVTAWLIHQLDAPGSEKSCAAAASSRG